MDVSDFEVSVVAFIKAVEADGMAGVSGDVPTAGEGAVASLTLLGLSDVDGTAAAIGGAGGSGVLGDTADGADGGAAAAVETSEGIGSVVRAEAGATGGQGGDGGIVLSSSGNEPISDGDGGAGGQAIGSQATAVNLSADGLASSVARQVGGAGGSGIVYGTSGAGGAASGTAASAYGHSAEATVVQTGGAGGQAIQSGSGADSVLLDAVTGATTGGTLVLSQTAAGGAGGGGGVEPGAGGEASSTLDFDDTRNAIAAQSVSGTSAAVGGAAGFGQEHSAASGGDATASLALIADRPVTAFATATGGAGSSATAPGAAGPGGTADATASAVSLTGQATANAVASGGLGIEMSPFGYIRAGGASAAANASAGSGQEATARATGTGYAGTVTTGATTSGSGLVSSVSATTSTTITAVSASQSETRFGGGFGLDQASNNFADASAMPVGAAPFATMLGSGAQGSKLTLDGVSFSGSDGFPAAETETFTTLDSFTVDGSALSGDLEAKLTGAAVSGGGFSSLDFIVDVGGTTIVDDAFTNAAAAAAFFGGTNLDLGPVGSGPVTVSFELDLTTSTVGDGFGETFVLGTADAPPCFAAGTRILTEAGEVAVEALSVGQRVVTADGVLPVVWIGRRRVDCRTQTEAGRPVRVLAGAFGNGLPRRDLVLSPDHAVFVSGVLIPVQSLVDGVAVLRDGRDMVSYYHVELERHAIVQAEGLTVESYLDTGNRSRFSNAAIVALHPVFEATTAGVPCAPMVFEGPVVDAVRSRLHAPGWAVAV